MTPEQFIAKWRGSTLTEKSASQSHFNDLCGMLEVPTPTDTDRTGAEYTFEKAVKKTKGGLGFVDVWKNHCFGWEYKGPKKNLVEAYAQLKQYTDDLQNPDKWIVDFGCSMGESEAALYEGPFKYVEQHVRPYRLTVRRERTKRLWWRHEECRPGLRHALEGRARFIATPRVAKHRIFVWLPSNILPDTRLVAVARDDDASFGVLHSRFHETWSLQTGGMHGVGNDPQYTPTESFGTFPFPDGLTLGIPVKADSDSGRSRTAFR